MNCVYFQFFCCTVVILSFLFSQILLFHAIYICTYIIGWQSRTLFRFIYAAIHVWIIPLYLRICIFVQCWALLLDISVRNISLSGSCKGSYFSVFSNCIVYTSFLLHIHGYIYIYISPFSEGEFVSYGNTFCSSNSVLECA
jgi:hypothetical protein